ncbi:AAA family ATPase [Algoriphagus marincola]|uniref:AAA family ATPase n=1 Tax=Algoriphagus marincola TaxID=264027 RepID=UPI000426D4B3|nr:ATP-binding protein [Algoriphagus marincola]
MNYIDDIPSELLNIESYPNDVNVLIGQNGSGKSTLLNELSKYYLRNQKNVIALANSIHDKFDSLHRNFKTLRGRSGRRQTRTTIKKALEAVGKEKEENRLKSATTALGYVGFDPMIGFRLERFAPYNLEYAEDDRISRSEFERLQYLIETTQRQSRYEEIIWLETEYLNFNDLEKSNLTELFYWESYLKKKKIISRIEVYLRKDGRELSMLNASSGELALITSIVYLSTIITDNTVILIDEPENSLHPLWQKEYAKTLLDIFYFYQPKIIIATHSPLIVNGAEIFSDSAKIFKSENFSFTLQSQEPLNIEELYYKFFDISTPENRYLSNRLVRLLNLLAERKLDIAAFNEEIMRIRRTSYQQEQSEALTSVQNLAQEIVSNNN